MSSRAFAIGLGVFGLLAGLGLYTFQGGKSVAASSAKIQAPATPPHAWDFTVSGESSTCSLHHVEMQKKSLPIIYGLPMEDLELSEAEARLFPNAPDYFPGGCVKEAEERATVYVCPECERTRKRWIQQRSPHPPEPSQTL